MVDYARLLALNTAKLTAAAESAAALSGEMSARGGEVAAAAQIPEGMWNGGDASAASVMMSPLANPLYDVSDSASLSQGVLETLVSELVKAQEMLTDAHNMLAGGLTISPDGTVQTPFVEDPAVAAENARLAQEIRGLIDRAIDLANKADDVAVGALASVGDGLAKLFGLPTSSPLGPAAWAPWATGQVLGRLGDVGGALAHTAQDALEQARWKTIGNLATRTSGAIGAVTAGAEQFAQDNGNPDISPNALAARTVWRGAVQGGLAFLGGVAGAAGGAFVGAGIPGGVVGGLGGAYLGNMAGDWIADNTVDVVGDITDNVSQGVGDAVDWVTPW